MESAGPSSWQCSNCPMAHEDDVQNLSDSNVPPYTSSSPTPSYSFIPGPDEHRLALSANLLHHRISGPSLYTAFDKSSGFKLELIHQGENANAPYYGRHAVVRGRVIPTCVETLKSVDLELNAILKVSIAEGGKKTSVLFKLVHTLWEKNTVGTQPCPDTLPFSIPLPSEYQENGYLRPLPPSYAVAYPGVPGLFAKCVFKVILHVKQARKMLWGKTSTLCVPFKYFPRTRAPRPIVKPTLPFLSLLKLVPEDFFQVEDELPTRSNSGVAPIRCHFFIPSSCIYALSDEIPFHVQLVGSAASIVAFTKATRNTTPSVNAHSHTTDADSTRISVASSHSTSRHSVPSNHTGSPLTLRVFLYRQVTVEVRGQRAWRTCVLGEGKLAPTSPNGTPPSTNDNPASMTSQPSLRPTRSTVPLSFSSRPLAPYAHDLPTPRYCTTCDGAALESLDWDGMVKVQSEGMGTDVGGFAAGRLIVKDFIVLSITPPDPPRNAFISHQVAKPIRLVTDPLEEGWDG